MTEINRFAWGVENNASGMEGMDLGVDDEWINFTQPEDGAVIVSDLMEEEIEL